MNQPIRYSIPQRTFAYKSYVELFNAFGNGWVAEKPGEAPVYKVERDECKRILDLGDLMIFQAGLVGSNVKDSKVRDSEIAWINDDPALPELQQRRELIGKMADIVGMVNRDKFQMLLDSFHPMQFTKYGLNQHYDWHVDAHEDLESNEHRKLSAVLMLTGPEEYEGGELELNIGGNPDRTVLLKPAAGTMVFFYSHIPHRVRPVTSGKRASIVVWALGPKIC
jgi:PKHD-type hydroxylase